MPPSPREDCLVGTREDAPDLRHQTAARRGLAEWTPRLSRPIHSASAKGAPCENGQRNRDWSWPNNLRLNTFLPTRGERISDQLKARRAIRNARRNRRNHRRHRAGSSKIFYRKPVPYPPSIRADVQGKLNVLERLRRWYPITDIQVEIVKLNIQRKVYGAAPQRRKRPGPKFVMQGVAPSAEKRLAILQRDGFRCLYCGASVTAETAHVHHFVQRKHGGSARYDIQGTLCAHCHTAVATQALALCFDITAYPNVRAAGRAMHGRLLLESRLHQWGLPVTVRYGYETAALREAFGVDKTHANDAMVLGCRPGVSWVDVAAAYTVKLHARHDGRKLFDVNPGVAAYRSAAARQPGVDPARMVVDEHDQATNVANRSYRRHVRQRYYPARRKTPNFRYGDIRRSP